MTRAHYLAKDPPGPPIARLSGLHSAQARKSSTALVVVAICKRLYTSPLADASADSANDSQRATGSAVDLSASTTTCGAFCAADFAAVCMGLVFALGEAAAFAFAFPLALALGAFGEAGTGTGCF